MSYFDTARAYAQGVTCGLIPACKWIRIVCADFLHDIDAQHDDEHEFYYDEHAADKACNFIETMPHTKGRWAAKGLKLKLEPWQTFFVCNVFGWMRKSDDLRRYRRAELFVPRKNGKSALAAAIAVYLGFADGEFGSEVYSGATTEAQAWEVYGPAKIMVEKSPQLIEYFDLDVRAKSISKKSDNSRLLPMIGKPRDGASPHGSIVDEYHEHDTDHMVETMESGQGSRDQPILLVITTAGDNLGGPCYKMQVAAQDMLERKLPEPDTHTFAMIFTVDKGDDWASLDTFKKANPNYGVSIYEDYYKRRVTDALNDSAKQAKYKTKQLNIWVGARDAYFNVQSWAELYDPDLRFEDFHGRDCFVGMDLATKIDVAAISLVFKLAENEYVRFSRFYVPRQRAELPENAHYLGWANEGWITLTEGNIIDFWTIKEDLKELAKVVHVRELAYDPYQATMLAQELQSEGLPVVEVGATVPNFSEPMKHWDAMIRAGNVRHDGNPVYTWMLANVVAAKDAKENVYPRKEREESKIDGVVADLMALNRCELHPVDDLRDAINDPIGGDIN